MEIIIEPLGLVKAYDSFNQRDIFLEPRVNLFNEKYFTNFKCHQCTNTFDRMCKISSIGRVTDDIMSSVNRILFHADVSLVDQLLPLWEIIQSIWNYTRATINRIRLHNYERLLSIQNRTTFYHLSRSTNSSLQTSTCTQNIFHLYPKHLTAILANNWQYCKYDWLRNPFTEPWDYDNCVVSINTVFYI